jgi:hypothetical protein
MALRELALGVGRERRPTARAPPLHGAPLGRFAELDMSGGLRRADAFAAAAEQRGRPESQRADSRTASFAKRPPSGGWRAARTLGITREGCTRSEGCTRR